jgi:hypothetical protein
MRIRICGDEIHDAPRLSTIDTAAPTRPAADTKSKPLTAQEKLETFMRVTSRLFPSYEAEQSYAKMVNARNRELFD